MGISGAKPAVGALIDAIIRKIKRRKKLHGVSEIAPSEASSTFRQIFQHARSSRRKQKRHILQTFNPALKHAPDPLSILIRQSRIKDARSDPVQFLIQTFGISHRKNLSLKSIETANERKLTRIKNCNIHSLDDDDFH